MKTLVTGGAGYVGNLLCKALLEAGHEVTAMDNFLYGYESILNLIPYENFHVLKQDIRGGDTSYLKGMDVVFHLAARNIIASMADPIGDMDVNIRGTFNVLKACEEANARRVVPSMRSHAPMISPEMERKGEIESETARIRPSLAFRVVS